MPLLASDIMTGARVILNDQAIILYTNAVMVGPVARANRELEKELINHGIEVVRQASPVIPLAANTVSPTLPSDFLLPVSLHERNQGATTSPWTEMFEMDWEPENAIPSNDLRYWAFRNNAIYTPTAIVAKDILLKYERALAVITGAASPEDFTSSQNFLEAKTAEICARYIGMNSGFADEIAAREVEPARDALVRSFVLNSQGTPTRRRRFTTVRSNVF